MAEKLAIYRLRDRSVGVACLLARREQFDEKPILEAAAIEHPSLACESGGLVAINGQNKVLGYCLWERNCSRSLEVTQLCVDRDHRRRGVAAALLASSCRAMNAREITLTITDRHPAYAYAWAEAVGFRCYHVTPEACFYRCLSAEPPNRLLHYFYDWGDCSWRC